MAYKNNDYEKQGASLMDGIPVKISEQYKPPKKITLPGTILNRLNCEYELPEYDFMLERSMMERMIEWRRLKREHREARRERNMAERQRRSASIPTTEANSSPPEPAETEPYPILTPVPIQASTNSQSTTYPRPFNISEFEQDTSSPFDNMELKTINDLEELAHVLQPIAVSDKNEPVSEDKKCMPPPRLNGFNAQYSLNSYNTNWTSSYGPMCPAWYQNPNAQQSYVVQRMDMDDRSAKGVAQNVQLLAAELKQRRLDAESTRHTDRFQKQSVWYDPGSEMVANTKIMDTTSSLHNPYSQLSASSQQLVDQLSEMGFPLPRVARAAELFKEDEAKIVEFLVEVQRLEELKYPGDRVERALVANEYKHQETIDYLNTIEQLVDLGFNEDRVERVLGECGCDRDKALDLLVS